MMISFCPQLKFATKPIEEHLAEYTARSKKKGEEQGNGPVLKRQRIVEPAKLVKTTYLETRDEVNAFLDTLRQELEHALEQNERVQIR